MQNPLLDGFFRSFQPGKSMPNTFDHFFTAATSKTAGIQRDCVMLTSSQLSTSVSAVALSKTRHETQQLSLECSLSVLSVRRMLWGQVAYVITMLLLPTMATMMMTMMMTTMTTIHSFKKGWAMPVGLKTHWHARLQFLCNSNKSTVNEESMEILRCDEQHGIS